MNFLIVVLILSSALEIFAERFSVENEIDPVIDFLLNGGDSNSGENVTGLYESCLHFIKVYF